MRSEEVVVSAHQLGKTYRLFGHPGDRIKQFFSLGLRRYHQEFCALRDVSFDIQRGEIVGIIGRNGSGKSTLLQLICGILTPSSGAVSIRGRVVALLELGAGFNPEFTGRENVYFQGSLMGLTTEQIGARLGAIAAFADIGSFIDQPVRTYSSGMFVRLAIAVAVHVEPDILVIDEALAVGDMAFQARSITRMKELNQRGTTIIVVSHSLPAIRNFCSRVLWLDRGHIEMDGSGERICLAYQEQQSRLALAWRKQIQPQDIESTADRSDDKPVLLTCVDIDAEEVRVGDSLAISLSYQASGTAKLGARIGLGVRIYNDMEELVALFNTARDDLHVPLGSGSIQLRVPSLSLPPGNYSLHCSIGDERILFAYDEWMHAARFRVSHEFNHDGIPKWEGQVACLHEWRF